MESQLIGTAATATDFSFLDDVAVRKSRLWAHPMLNQNYWVKTPEGEGLFDVLYSYALRRKSGLYAVGLNRVGKTDALERAADRLRIAFPHMPVFVVIGKRLANQSKEAFCKYLLDEFGYAVLAVPKQSSFERILINFLIAECVTSGGQHFQLLVDEAQLFSVTQYRYLLEIWNALKKPPGYLMCTALIGQVELHTLKSLSTELDHTAVVARFFVKCYTFHGVKSLEILQAVLRSYDSDLRYPESSSWTYSRYFAKNRFDRGWRLEKEADLFWRALVKVAHPKKSSSIAQNGFRMGWIVDTVHSFLVDAMTRDETPWHSDVATWEKHLQAGSIEDMLI